jgi:hypothetical protein
MHFDSDPGNVSTLLDDIESSWSSNMLKSMTVESRLTTLVATPLDGTSASLSRTLPNSAPYIGGVASGTSSPQVATLVKLQTDKRGKSHRGRVFLPFTAEGAQNDGKLDTTPLANLQTGWSAFVTDVATAGEALVVASYKLESFEPVTQAIVESFFGTQRKRQPRP